MYMCVRETLTPENINDTFWEIETKTITKK